MSYDFGANSRYMTGTFGVARGTPITVVAWVKLTAAQWGETSQRYLSIFGTDFGQLNNSLMITKTHNSANMVTARSRTTSDVNATHTHTAGTYDDLWVPLIATYNSASLRRIYIENSGNVGSNTSTRDVGNGIDELRIGSDANGFVNFRGLVAEVAVFDKALSTGEIDALHTGPNTGPAPNTVASANCIGYWPLATDSATHADQSGNGGPTLTNNNGVYTADHPTITAGSKTVSVQLADIDGNNRLNLGNITWAWYDAVPQASAPTDTGLIASDADGNINVAIPNTSLAVGQTGYLALRVPSGNWNNIYPLVVSG